MIDKNIVSNVYTFINLDKLNLAKDLIDEYGIADFNCDKALTRSLPSHCIKHDKHHFLQELLSLGLNINVKDSFGQNALFFCKNAFDIHFLFKNGIALNEKDNSNKTALDFLIIDAQYGKGYHVEERILTLISLGLNIKIKT
jgi:ankyrin repeat protein